VTSRFFDLQGAKSSANTQEQQPIKFSFSCIDFIGACGRGVAAYDQKPAQNVVTFCSIYFSSRAIALSKMCSTPSFQPSNDAFHYAGTHMCYCHASDTLHIDAGATLLHEFMHVESIMNSQPVNGMSWCKCVPLDQVLTVTAARSNAQQWEQGECYAEPQCDGVLTVIHSIALRTGLWVCCIQASGNPELRKGP
jgi:hypothetical protein